MLKVMKLKKSDYSNLEGLLKRAGLVDDESKRAFPQRIFISKCDSKKFIKEITKTFKKEYPYLNTNKIKTSVGMYWLNLGPSEAVDVAVKPGYALILERENDK